MASNVNWFVIWVPSASSEIENHANKRDKSKSPASISLPDVPEQNEIVTESKIFEVIKIKEVDGENLLSDSDTFEKQKSVENNVSFDKGAEIVTESKTFEVTKITEVDNNNLEKRKSVVNNDSFDKGVDHKDEEDESQRATTPDTDVAEVTENTAEAGADETITQSSGDFLKWEATEDIVKRVIAEKPIGSLHIVNSVDKKQTQISFCVCFDQVEDLLLELQNNGIGQVDHSSISVFPSSIHVSPDNEDSKEPEPATAEAKMDKFYSTIKSRLLVSEVIARIEAGAEFSFDFLLLLVLAGMIAFMGLMENSSVVLVASMLVSPLMGPILAGIFGGTVQDRHMTMSGIRHEVYALMICIMIGFVLGLLIVPWIGTYGIDQFPTTEMLGRGELRSLWVGVLIAVPSGAGVALSVLGGNAGSLVGVAISASLLPPAVNCGLYWAVSLVQFVGSSYGYSAYHGYHDFNEELNITIVGYKPRYSDDLSLESFLLGLVSLTLTLINILCIIITGVLILKLKEVTPAKVPQKFSHFWRTDVRAHRDYYKAIKKGEKRGPWGSEKNVEDGTEDNVLQSLFERAAADTDLSNIQQWVVMSSAASERSPNVLHSDPWKSGYHGLPLDEEKSDYKPVYKNQDRKGNHRVWSAGQRPPLWRTGTHLHPDNNHLTVNPGTYLNVSQFVEKELKRSREVRKRLNENMNGKI